MSEEGFQVTEEVNVGDLSAVKEQRQIMPATSALKVQIQRATVQETKDKDIKSLKLTLNIVDGIEVPIRDEAGNPTGETKVAYVNGKLFTGLMDLVFWADKSVKGRAEKNWWKNDQHLVQLKRFWIALGLDPKAVKINDEVLSAMIGREILVDVQHEEETGIDESSGERVKLGTFRERLRNWKAIV